MSEWDSYPRGWFVIAMSSDLGPGDVTKMTYFGRDFVLYRGESGTPHVMDAYCPHLGAHLGVGGEVEGDALRCPFHAWRFGADGKCDEIPYAKKIPPRACVRAWQLQEKNGLVFLWHCPEGSEPSYEIPEMPELSEPAWMPWQAKLLSIATHPREVVENLADKGHFPKVHGTHANEFDNEYRGHIGVQRTKGVAYPRSGGEDPFELEGTYYGPGYMISKMAGVLENRLLLAHTPIDKNSLHLRFGVSLKLRRDSKKADAFAQQYIENLQVGFEEDIAIWEHKVYRDRPTLCDGDGPIGKLRRWYRQFYLPLETADAAQ